jgi:hypothetical protein
MKTKVDAKTIGGLIMYGMRNKLIEYIFVMVIIIL